MRKLLYFLQYLVYWTATRAMRLIPHSTASALGERIGRLVFVLPLPHRRLTLENLALAFPEKSARERRQIARECFGMWTRMLFEQGSLERFDEQGILDLFDEVGRENLERAREGGRGVLFVSEHSCSMEVCSYFLGLSLGGIHILVRPPSNPWIAKELEDFRHRTRHYAIPRRRSAIRIAKILRDGGITGLAPDQRVRPDEGVLIDFLGHPAWTSAMPARLAGKHGAALLPVTCEPLPQGRVRFTYLPPIFPKSSEPEEVLRHTKTLNQHFADHIRSDPKLWLWMHNRWLRCAIHRWPESKARIRRESGLPESNGSRPTGIEDLMALVDEPLFENGIDILIESDDPGGASELLAEAGRRITDQGHPVLWANAAGLARELAEIGDGDERETAMRRFDRFDLLILDDLGSAHRTHPEALASLVRHRSGRRSILAAVDAAGDRTLTGEFKPDARRLSI